MSVFGFLSKCFFFFKHNLTRQTHSKPGRHCRSAPCEALPATLFRYCSTTAPPSLPLLSPSTETVILPTNKTFLYKIVLSYIVAHYIKLIMFFNQVCISLFMQLKVATFPYRLFINNYSVTIERNPILLKCRQGSLEISAYHSLAKY